MSDHRSSTDEKVQQILQQVDHTNAQGPFAANWESIVAGCRIPLWYEDGKFGIFIHWGLYCVPAFGDEWYPRNMYQPTMREFEYHRKVFGPQSKFGYKDFIPMFNAEQFDALAWATLFKQAGARFVVPVAEHHDGFAMYDSALSRWTAARMGPKRDIIGELAHAVREQGMIFGVSSHRAEHWFFFDGGRTFDSDVQDPQLEDFYGPARPKPVDQFDPRSPNRPDARFLDDWLARCCELVDKYRPQILWFDWWIEHVAFRAYLQRFAAYYYNRAAQWNGGGAAINYKYNALPDGAGVFDIERGQLKGIRQTLWQNDTSVSKNSWGYIAHHNYKTTTSIVHDLIDVVSKNGALLLNIGPKADGTIPAPEQQMLREIGQWLNVNGTAIYGTRPWLTFGEGPTAVVEGSFTDTKRAAFTARDIRFTAKPDALFAILLGWPGDGRASVESLGSNSRWAGGAVGRVTMLGHDAPLKFRQEDDALRVELPPTRPCDHAWVLKIERA